MLLVLDVLGKDVQPIDGGSESRRKGRTRGIAPFHDLSRSACRIGGDMRLETQPAGDLAALPERMNVAVDVGDLFDLAPGGAMSWKRTRKKCSPTMCRSALGSK